MAVRVYSRDCTYRKCCSMIIIFVLLSSYSAMVQSILQQERSALRFLDNTVQIGMTLNIKP